MNSELKSSEDYLSPFSINQYEKTHLWIREISAYLRNNQVYKMLEIGPGSGHTIKLLKDRFGKKLEVTAIDTNKNIIEGIRNDYGVTSLQANAIQIPLQTATFDGINASSVLHEIYTYGGSIDSKLVKDVDAVRLAFTEFNRLLKPNGILFYRDVLAPNYLDQIIKVKYKYKSWQLFIKWFLPGFIESKPDLYQDSFNLVATHDGQYLTAPSRLHKEIQKHYLNFVFYFSYSKSKDIGFKITKETSKYMITSNRKLRDIFNTQNQVVSEDRLNQIIDSVIAISFSDRSFSWIMDAGEYDSWLKREGREHYVYLSCLDVVDIANQVSSDSSEKLTPIENTDVNQVIRFGYNHYLRDAIDFPELDGTQTIKFTKRTL